MLLKLQQLIKITKQYFPKTWQKWSFKDKVKFLSRTLLAPRITMRYLEAVCQLPQYPQLDENEYFLGKIHRPYLAKHIQQQRASDIIIYHHRYLSHLLPKKLLQQLYTEGLTLCQFSAKSQHYQINLSVSPQFNKEGEITFILYSATQQALMSLSCTIADYQNQTCIIIGGLQGAGVDQAAAIKLATKDCYGLFPKRILFEALQITAHALQINSIYAVSNQQHIYQSSRYRKRKQHYFLADYDQFWQEMDGHFDLAQQMFKLSNRIVHKPLSQIASKKRAQYKRRHHLQRTIARKIACALRTL